MKMKLENENPRESRIESHLKGIKLVAKRQADLPWRREERFFPIVRSIRKKQC